MKRAMWGRRGTDVLLCLVLFFVFFLSGFLRQARAQTGFTSIDCGATADYTDSIGIDWVTDGGFTSTGENVEIDITQADLGADSEQNGPKLQTLRSFPGPASKNCYFLPVAVNENRLVRLMFLGGSFSSGLTTAPSFSVSLGNAFWLDVEVTDPWTPVVKEATFIPVEETLLICFQRGLSGVPFVNSIETRPLTILSYQLILSQFIYTNLYRLDCGLKSGSPSIRYPDDPRDRIWAADPRNISFPSIINKRVTVDNNFALLDNDPPPSALQSAWNASRITFTWPFPKYRISSNLYYFAFYFLEVAGLRPTDIREIDIYLDGNLVRESPLRPNSSTIPAWGVSAKTPITNVTIIPSENSTVPFVILNAAEVYETQSYNTSISTLPADVTTIQTIKERLNLTEWQGEPCLFWPYDWLTCSNPAITQQNKAQIITVNLAGYNLSGTIPEEIGNLAQLQDLSLANNNLTGEIPDFSNLVNLKSLRLQNNKLKGPIPVWLSSLPELAVLILDNNQLEGGLPSGLQEKIDSGVLTFSAVNNPYLCIGSDPCTQPPSSAPTPSSPRKDKKSSSVGIVIGAAAGGAVVVLLGLLLLFFKCRRTPAPKPGTGGGGGSTVGARQGMSSNQPKSFTWDEVTAATRNFSKLLGTGGYGDVYYGQLPDGRKVAVKVNKGNTQHGKDQFLNEVSLLSRVHHRHLVSFFGYCNEGNHEVLIYDFMAQGNLQDHITGSGNSNTGILDWKTRLDIVLNASKGLEYLHNSCTPPIIHRDIKSANILLNENLVAKVSDFGISKPTNDEDRTRGVTTAVKGSFGYLDPAYFHEHRLTQKSDVYSMGVVMLEVITGKRPTTVDFPNSRASNLLEWVQTKIRDGDIGAITDPAMGSNYKAESVWKTTELAIWCLHPNVADRPDMTRVLQELTSAMDLQTHQNTVTVYPSPSNLPPSAYDQYQRVQETPKGAPRGESSRSSYESIATVSIYTISAR